MLDPGDSFYDLRPDHLLQHCVCDQYFSLDVVTFRTILHVVLLRKQVSSDFNHLIKIATLT